MASTYTSLHYHVVFSTKDRQPLLKEPVQRGLHPYLGGVARELGATPVAIGGVEDHVHMLLGLKATHRLSDCVRDIKRASALWVGEKLIPGFHWQDGYAAFTVGSSGMDAVKAYIADQVEHHKSFSYLDELKRFLEEAGVQYDERYLE